MSTGPQYPNAAPLSATKIEGSAPGDPLAPTDWAQVARAAGMAAAVGLLTWLQANWSTINFGAYTQALAVIVPPFIVYLIQKCSDTRKQVVK